MSKNRILEIIVLTLILSNYACSNKIEKENIVQEKVEDKEHQAIFQELEKNDSLLFDVGFNQCDTNEIKKIVSNDFELYHDQAGITNSKEKFIESIKGLCSMTYRPSRNLKKGSLKVYLLKENGKVYGAIQEGEHMFYGEEENKPKYLTSTANFTHLWIKEDEKWKLKRVLSYNHIAAKNE